MRKEYESEFDKQLKEIMGRIEERRTERIKEEKERKDREVVIETKDGQQEVVEKAPLGPGGLDPSEVLQTLPKDVQEAFVNQDREGLVKAMQNLKPEEAQYHLTRCIDSGLWNPGGDEEEEE